VNRIFNNRTRGCILCSKHDFSIFSNQLFGLFFWQISKTITKLLYIFSARIDLRYTTIVLLTNSIVASSGSRFEIRNDNFIHKFLWQLWAKLDLRYTMMILRTNSIVASSGSRFEIHNDNFIHKILCQLWAKPDLRYTTITLLTNSIVASSESRFEIHNDNAKSFRKVSDEFPKSFRNREKFPTSFRNTVETLIAISLASPKEHTTSRI